jgi:HK97 gp10 family phage protein
MNVRFHLTGVEQLARRFDAWAGGLKRALAPALLTGAAVIADEARRLAPVKTGRLKQGIVAVSPPGAATPAAEIQCQAPYSRAVEFGTRRTPARPYLLPAMLLRQRDALRAIADLLRERNK